MELAVASKAVVPALTVDVAGVDALKTAPIIAVTPEQREVPVEAAIQTTPPTTVATTGSSSVQQTGLEARQLPATAGVLPWIVLLGFTSIAAAFGLTAVCRKPAYSSVR